MSITTMSFRVPIAEHAEHNEAYEEKANVKVTQSRDHISQTWRSFQKAEIYGARKNRFLTMETVGILLILC